ncbi:hypothetical protein M404DRAFT_1003277 [Pisolithus tinctorius Marx 270]|uniref:Uncharacterized protein n=1 Tax=Pisolithus tinctorius Marx 270 TaxID=870435 RepID=A0A0C3P0E5_PISTI|nr:hypothetical protein M404DRAFT_1003277 [Pisolithus tinctorius Marx 270]
MQHELLITHQVVTNIADPFYCGTNWTCSVPLRLEFTLPTLVNERPTYSRPPI